MADVPEYKELITKINPFFAQHEDLEFFAKWLEAFDTCCEYLVLESHVLINTKTLHDFYYGRKTSWLIIDVPSTISTITRDGVEYGIIPYDLPVFELVRIYINTDTEIPAVGDDNKPNFFVYDYDDKSTQIALRKSIIDNNNLYGKQIMLYRAKLHDDLVYKALGNLIQEPIDRDSFDYYKKVLGKYVFQIKQKNKTNIKDAVGFIAGLNYDFGDDIFKRFQSLDEYLKIKTSLEGNLLPYLFDEDFKKINQLYETDKIKIVSNDEIYFYDNPEINTGDLIKIFKNNKLLLIGEIIDRYNKSVNFGTGSYNVLVHKFFKILKFDEISSANYAKVLKMNNNKNIVMCYRENHIMNIEDYSYLQKITPLHIYLIIRNLFVLADTIKEKKESLLYGFHWYYDLTDYASQPEASPISADAIIDSDVLTIS